MNKLALKTLITSRVNIKAYLMIKIYKNLAILIHYKYVVTLNQAFSGQVNVLRLISNLLQA